MADDEDDVPTNDANNKIQRRRADETPTNSNDDYHQQQQQQQQQQPKMTATTTSIPVTKGTTTSTTNKRSSSSSSTNNNNNHPLSMTFMRSLSGVGRAACCSNCGNRFDVLHDWDPQVDNGNHNDNGDPSAAAVTMPFICLETSTTSLASRTSAAANLAPPPSAVSPLVWAPMMMMTTTTSTATSTTAAPDAWQQQQQQQPFLLPQPYIMPTPSHAQRLLMDYMTICQFYGCRENVGVLTTLRYSLPACRVSPGFGDVDMLALAELWLYHTATATATAATNNNIATTSMALPINHNNNNNSNNGSVRPQTNNGFHRNTTSSSSSSSTSLLQHVIRLDLSLASSKAAGAAMAAASSHSMVWNFGNGGGGGAGGGGGGGRRYATSPIGGISSHGALALAKLLQQPSCPLQQVYLPRNRIGPFGATAIFCAAATNPTLHTLHMRRCRIGQRGALAFCQLILNTTNNKNTFEKEQDDDPNQSQQQSQQQQQTSSSSSFYNYSCGLRNIDLSANFIGFQGCHAIEQALLQRQLYRQKKAKEYATANANANANKNNIKNGNNNNNSSGVAEPPALPFITVNLEGNLVFQEIMNGVTHGLGVILGVLACIFLSLRVRNKSWTHIASCAVYSTSLLVLYISSTLYHSFFCLQQTRYLFEIFDKSAIYILIAGSYTPFLQIVLRDNPLWSNYLLTFLWLCCIGGISVEAYWPTWKYKVYFSLAMYLGMGWSAVVVLPEVMDVAPTAALRMLVLGGVAYTSGVPFFVRNHNLDHSIWHLFVLAGSALHWIGIYEYVATYPYSSSSSSTTSTTTTTTIIS